MKNSIESLRKEIDKLDFKLVPLICEREKIVKKIAKLKVMQGIPARQEIREEEIIKKC